MLAWLGEWLKSIIAVVLLAAVIDLLMPGKAFQRYTRLVLGLLILLAMLGPLLKLLEARPEELLDRGIRSWEAASGREAPRMPGLDDIRRDAEALRERQERQAAELAAIGLETAMLEALNRGGGLHAEAVKVGLASGPNREARIASVTVTLAPLRSAADEGQPSGKADGDSDDYGAVRQRIGITPIAPVREVEVAIAAEAEPVPDGPAGRTEEPSGGRHASERDAAAVRSIVYSGWGVEPERIIVLTTDE